MKSYIGLYLFLNEPNFIVSPRNNSNRLLSCNSS